MTQVLASSAIHEWGLDDITERDVHVTECLRDTLTVWSKEYIQQESTSDEVPVSMEDLQKFTGTYLPGKIHIEVKNEKLNLVRVNQNIHIELYCVSPNAFMRRNEEQSTPHKLLTEGADKPAVWGYKLVSKEFI